MATVTTEEKLRRWKKIAKVRARLLAKSDAKLTRILCDPKYKGGVQYWIKKYDRLMLTLARVLAARQASTK